MTKPQALVVDDEVDLLDLLTITLARMGITASTVENIANAKHLLASKHFDLCLTDMRLPDGSGIDLVAYIAERYPDLPVAMITAHGNMDSAVAAMKVGAFDFVSKPLDLQVLRRLVQAALRLKQSDRSTLSASASQLLGQSSQIEELRRLIAKLARNQAPVFISGESGTGKELAARLIHAEGPRAQSAFVPVNCGAIPSELVESEFFGYKKGSFTGAVSDKEGLFQTADGGTLFLDEVADLPLAMQVKLLRAIQEKSVRPVGGQQEIPVDARIISASHKDLNGEVEKGTFRQDLFYRINVIELRIPTLRERSDDIPLLAEHIAARIAKQAGRELPKLSDSALQALQRHHFPGNVRELENILERALALCDDAVIDSSALYLPQANAPDSPEHALDLDVPLEDYLGEIEKQAIMQALEETHWNRTAAAKKLGMTLRSLRYRLDKLGLD